MRKGLTEKGAALGLKVNKLIADRRKLKFSFIFPYYFLYHTVKAVGKSVNVVNLLQFSTLGHCLTEKG